MLQIKEVYKTEMYSPIGMFAEEVVDDETDKALQYQDLIYHEKYRETWTKAFVKQLDQLAQGLCSHQGTITIKCIKKYDVLGRRIATYA
eukprot:8848538-Ditylum_brightwellii.AAC.1